MPIKNKKELSNQNNSHDLTKNYAKRLTAFYIGKCIGSFYE